MFHALVKETNMHGVMIDNFILSANEKVFREQIRVRMERELEIPITYGLSLGEKVHIFRFLNLGSQFKFTRIKPLFN